MEITNQQLRDKVDKIATMARETFTRESAGDTCVICPGKPRDEILQVTWQAEVPKPTSVGEVVGETLADVALGAIFQTPERTSVRRGYSYQKKETVTFDTYHPICAEGVQILKKHRQVSVLTRGICTFFTVISSIALVVGAIYIVSGYDAMEPADDTRRLGYALAIPGLCILVASIIWGRRARSYGLPTAAFEKIAQSPIEMSAWTTVA